MSKLEDIQKAVEQLSPEKLAEFRAWFEEFDAALFDAKLERDIRTGALDEMADDALRGFREGRTREL